MPAYKVPIRDGVAPWFRSPLPQSRVPQRPERDPILWEAMKKKLQKAQRLGYLAQGPVKSLTSFFSVHKGTEDIRMVYDGTRSGLNEAMWAPWFSSPTIEAHLRFVDVNTFLGDINIGDMFLNFILHEDVRVVAGIDLTPFFPEELEGNHHRHVIWE